MIRLMLAMSATLLLAACEPLDTQAPPDEQRAPSQRERDYTRKLDPSFGGMSTRKTASPYIANKRFKRRRELG